MALRIIPYLYTTTFGKIETIETSAKKRWGRTLFRYRGGKLMIKGIDSPIFSYPLTDEVYEKLTDKEFQVDLELRKSELGFIVEAWRCYSCDNLE